MRKSALDVLMPRSRRGILCTLLGAPRSGLHLSEIARRLGVPPSSLQRELAALRAAEILLARRDGNRVAYSFNEDCPFLPELRGLLIKTAGLVEVLRSCLAPLQQRIRVALVYGSAARGTESATSDVDLLVIGSITPREVSRALSGGRSQLSRELNPVLFSPEDFARAVREKRAFPGDLLERERVFVLGDARDLEELAGAAIGRTTAARPARDR